MNILDFAKRKQAKKPITMVTCYDYTLASILNETPVDCILVGDSAAMVMHGFDTTIPATTDMICFHLKSVAKGASSKFIVGDMPFMSYRKGELEAFETMERIIRSGACAVKLEGFGNEEIVKKAVTSGIPVMGHLGLTVQQYHALGGFRIQGRNDKGARELLEGAKALEDAGAFAIVLECIPKDLAKEISESLSIPTIGIGAGPHVDGQVLVSTDLLGLTKDLNPKFSRQYLKGREIFSDAFNQFHSDVHEGCFPSIKESF